MRTRLAMKNIIISLLLEIVTALSGMILPRFFTVAYGSSVNGLVSSISQFITYMSLVEAGVSAAGIVELYRPLADHDFQSINGILSAVKQFYYKSGAIFLFLDIALIIGYPYIVNSEITDVNFIRVMIVILSLNGIIDYFFLGKYRVLLMADQRNYIISLAQILGTLIIMILSIVLIEVNANPLIVKATVPIVYIFRTSFVSIYAHHHYRYLDFSVAANNNAFKQKSSALVHQIVGMICNNTDVVLLTVMIPVNALVQVSVYTIYSYVSYAITSLFNSISTGIRASFGQVLAEGDNETLEKSYSLFEYGYYILLFSIYTCMAILMYPFISLYCEKFADSYNYISWKLVIIFSMCGLIQNLRIPGSTVQVAAGHFKQTQNAAILEATINFVISICLVKKWGIFGVLVGTCASYLYRTIYILIYHEKHFCPGTIKKTLSRIFRSCLGSGIVIILFANYVNHYISNWISWIVAAIIICLLSVLVVCTINALFEPDIFSRLLRRCLKTVKSSKEKRK